MIALTEPHIREIETHLRKSNDNRSVRRALLEASSEIGDGLHDNTAKRIVAGKPLTDPTVRKLVKVLAHLGFDELAKTDWLRRYTPPRTTRKTTLATFVDPNLDEGIRFQQEISRIAGMHVIYRRFSSTGVSSSANGHLVRELLYIPDDPDWSTAAYLVTKSGAVYKGHGIRSHDMWKFEFFRVLKEKEVTISRTLKLQAHSAAIRQNVIGGVLVRTTEKTSEASVTDVIAIRLPTGSSLHNQGQNILDAYTNRVPLYPDANSAPRTVLRLDRTSKAERAIYDRLVGTIKAPDEFGTLDVASIRDVLRRT